MPRASLLLEERNPYFLIAPLPRVGALQPGEERDGTRSRGPTGQPLTARHAASCRPGGNVTGEDVWGTQ